jgi:glucose-1-phosphate thymidylyltransferase
MIAVLLAGGYATRLWPATKDRTKVLLPIGEEKVIEKHLSEIQNHSEIEKTYISTNKKFEDDMKSFVKNNNYDVEVSVEPTKSEDQKMGVIGALADLVERETLSGKDLLVFAGDNIMSIDIDDLIDQYNGSDPIIATYDVESKDMAENYGIVNVDSRGYIESFDEKPNNPDSTLASTACYVFSESSVLFDEYLSEDNNPDAPGWYIKWLINRRNVKSYDFNEYWFDIGTRLGYLNAVEHFVKDPVIQDEEKIEGSDIKGSTIIEENVEVKDSQVNNCVLLADSELHNCNLDRCVVSNGSIVKDSETEESILE